MKLLSRVCLTLWHPMDYSLPGSSVHEIFQARGLKWVAISFSRGSFRPRDRTQVSHIAGRCFSVSQSLQPVEYCILHYTMYCILYYNTTLLYSTGSYSQYPVVSHNRKEYEKEYVYMYIHLSVHQKLIQYCKSTIFQLKKKDMGRR